MEVGRDPLAARVNVFHHVETVVAPKQRAVTAKAAEGGADKFETGRERARSQKVRNQSAPETGQRFVIAAVIGIRRADASVVVDDAETDFPQSFISRVVEDMASGNSDVSCVRPLFFRKRTGAPASEEGAQSHLGASKVRIAHYTVFDCTTILCHCIRRLYSPYY